MPPSCRATWTRMDKELENHYLEGAALGDSPTEMTYLNKPLSKDLNPEVRKGVAAALVGKPVMGIAKRRQQAGSTQSGTPPPEPQRHQQRTTGPPLRHPRRPQRRQPNDKILFKLHPQLKQQALDDKRPFKPQVPLFRLAQRKSRPRQNPRTPQDRLHRFSSQPEHSRLKSRSCCNLCMVPNMPKLSWR